MRKPWTTGERARLAALRGSGLSVSACARTLGRSVGSVSQSLWRMGLCRPLKYARRKRGRLMQACVQLKRLNKGATEIADRLGVCRAVVYETLARIKRRGAMKT